jgi:hypothetical protein
MKRIFTGLAAIVLFIVDAHSSMLFAQTDSATGKIYFMGSPKRTNFGELQRIYGF